MTSTPRKRIMPPALPSAESRLDELAAFVALLSDRFIDYDYYDVYDSVFRKRVDEIIDTVKFDSDSQHIHEFGVYIQATNSTKARDFMKFFQMIIAQFAP
jgi:NDP-sugar pyrophosphorylase family protein